ncbi:alkaline phosphatase family protein [Candidatus Dependentiae bacterium]|nr:alkaline phosphatase family protein [Candidatus Dependentiae bacterium]
MGKVYFIGIDAGDFKYIHPLIKEGALPNFKKIIDGGVEGVLLSTHPPLTPVAWTTLLSGVDKTIHKIFSWTKFTPQNKLVPINSRDIKIPRIWDILNYYNTESVIINFPLTYPATEIKGLMISGFDSPTFDDKAIAGNSGIIKQFMDRFKDYEISVEYKEIYKGKDHFKEKWLDDTIEKTRVLKYLKEQDNPEFIGLVYMVIDHLNHYFSVEKEEHTAILNWAYKILDKQLGKILELLKKDDTLFICSDHGSIYIKKNFYLNKWLMENGYLYFKDKMFPRAIYKNAYKKITAKCKLFKIFSQRLFIGITRLLFKLTPVFLKRKIIRSIRGKTVLGYSYDCIDFEKTLAFTKESYGQLFINKLIVKESSEKVKIIKEILEKLKYDSVNHLVPEFKVLKDSKVIMNNENEPDIELKLLDEEIYFNTFNFSSNSNFIEKNSQSYKGDHRMEGIFIAFGDKIHSGYKLKEVLMPDIVPTVLTKLNLKIPSYLKGKILLEIFTEDLKPEFLTVSSGEINLENSKKDFNLEETKKKLENLGYL